MDIICEHKNCTGCGMCTNICPRHAIMMEKGEHGFIFPKINQDLCINCGLCEKRCPGNIAFDNTKNVQKVYASWNKNKKIRKESTSGGVFTLLAETIIKEGGVVVGVVWDDEHHPKHIVIDRVEDLFKFRGSKYSQSNTNDIYIQVKKYLDNGTKVLFSGTPCQNEALRSYLGKEYYNLFNIDLICHGVPSNQMLDDYFNLFQKKIENVRLRYKDPYWDYCYVRVDFLDKTRYQELTINDDYFNLFNIGYTLRESCHNCKYTNTHRHSDITIADFWGYSAHNLKSSDYNKGTSLILVNSNKGVALIEKIKKYVFIEEQSLEKAIRGNKCLMEPFKIDEARLSSFWKDYDNGMNIHELNVKYCANTFKIPKNIILKRIYNKYRWIIKK